MAKRDEIGISWKASVGLAIFFAVWSEATVAALIFRQSFGGLVWSPQRITAVVSLTVAAIAIPIPLVAMLRLNRRLGRSAQVSFSAEESPLLYQKWLNSALLMTYVTIQLIATALTTTALL